MKKIISGFIGVLFVFSSYAVDLTLVSYDANYYGVVPAEIAAAGQLTGVSDIYYYYKPFEQKLILEQIEWLGDGDGGVYQRPESPVYNYTGITFDNMAEQVMFDSQNIADLKNQFDNWVVDNVSEIIDLSILNISRNIVKQHNIDVYNSVFSNAKFGKDKFSVWGTTLFNSMNKSGKYDYSTNGLGVILGVDWCLSDTVLLGIGYSYSNTDVDISPSDILFDNSSLFLYSKWKPTKFYLNAIMSYDFADYEYVGSDFNNGDISSLFASVMAGYNTDSGISPEIGIRYTSLEINQNSENLKKSETYYSSVVAGVNYKRALGDFMLGGRVAVEYDIIQPDNNIYVDVLGYNYYLTIENSERPLGAEFGLLLSYNFSNVDLQLKYDARLRSDFINQTGGVSIKCAF